MDTAAAEKSTSHPKNRIVEFVEYSGHTWAGMEAYTDSVSFVGAPQDLKKGEKIEIEYRSTHPNYALWFFVRRSPISRQESR